LDFVWIALITVTILQLSVLYTTIYLHRRSLIARYTAPGCVNVMHLHLTLFTGLVPREWAAVHRKHHHFSDHEGDPHSPKVFGMWKVLFGNYFYYRRETKNPTTVNKYTPDYQPDSGGSVLSARPVRRVHGTWHFHADVRMGVGIGRVGVSRRRLRVAEFDDQQPVP
jgi:fatty-acid desaturase